MYDICCNCCYDVISLAVPLKHLVTGAEEEPNKKTLPPELQ